MSDNAIIFQRTLNYEGKSFETLRENEVPMALEQAQGHVKSGFVFTAPDLIEQRINHPDLNHPFWNRYTTLTEENRIEETILTFHGGYVFNTPKRIKTAISQGLINGAGRLTDKEIKILKASIKKGAIQDTQIPIINYGDFIKFTQSQIL
ncbi:hypothetical protein HY498_00945 [Candidatus Woesearchaeota archaeon]|nr:hypothetical protein [Candidatus Woesearchaeota archaeon]